MTIAEFQATSDAKEWYRVVNSDIFQRVLRLAENNSVAKRLSLVGNPDVKEHCQILVGQVQGWNDAFEFLTVLLLKPPEKELPEPSYQEDA